MSPYKKQLYKLWTVLKRKLRNNEKDIIQLHSHKAMTLKLDLGHKTSCYENLEREASKRLSSCICMKELT